MTPAARDVAAFIQAHLPVQPVPGIPEIRLHKAVPTSGLWRLAKRDEAGFGSPYWAHHWAGGLALARHLLDHPHVVAGQCVLDLGAGSGLVAIAAARCGATGLRCHAAGMQVAPIRLAAAADSCSGTS